MPENHTLPRVLRQGGSKTTTDPEGHRSQNSQTEIFICREKGTFILLAHFSELSRFQISDVHNVGFLDVRTCQVVWAILKDIKRGSKTNSVTKVQKLLKSIKSSTKGSKSKIRNHRVSLWQTNTHCPRLRRLFPFRGYSILFTAVSWN